MKLYIFLLAPLVIACNYSTNNNNVDPIKKDTFLKNNPTPDQSDTTHILTFYEFLDAIKKNDSSEFLNFITVEKEFPSDWVKSSNIDTLISLIESRDRCRCVLNPISSYIPSKEKANLGGYAILILNSYRNNKPLKFSLWACPTTNEKDVKEILIWNKLREK